MPTNIRRELRATLAQKAGIQSVLMADAAVLAVMGVTALAAFGAIMPLLALIGVGVKPHDGVAEDEGAAALGRGETARAARLFALVPLAPAGWAVWAGLVMAVASGAAARWVGAEGAAALGWYLAAHAVGTAPMGAIRALRKARRSDLLVASTWTLAGVNVAGDLLSLWMGWGIEGVAGACFAAEVAACWMPLRHARRLGLIARPTWADMRHVLRESWPLYLSAVVSAGEKVFNTAFRLALGEEGRAALTLVLQAFENADLLAAQLTKVGIASEQAGCEEDARVAYRWGAWVIAAALPFAGWWGGIAGVVVTAMGYGGLRAYAYLKVRGLHARRAAAEAAERIMRLAVAGTALAVTTPTMTHAVLALVAGQVVYMATAWWGRE